MQVLFTPSYEEYFDYSGELPSFYRIHPTSKFYAQALVAFIRRIEWQRFSVLSNGRGGGRTFFSDVRKSIYGCEVLKHPIIWYLESAITEVFELAMLFVGFLY